LTQAKHIAREAGSSATYIKIKIEYGYWYR